MMIYSSFSLFLTHLWIGFVSCAVYHILPSPDDHCPVEPCLTLSSFAANASLYLDNNTSLILQSGNHTVHSQLKIASVFSQIFYDITFSQAIKCRPALPVEANYCLFLFLKPLILSTA